MTKTPSVVFRFTPTCSSIHPIDTLYWRRHFIGHWRRPLGDRYFQKIIHEPINEPYPSLCFNKSSAVSIWSKYYLATVSRRQSFHTIAFDDGSCMEREAIDCRSKARRCGSSRFRSSRWFNSVEACSQRAYRTRSVPLTQIPGHCGSRARYDRGHASHEKNYASGAQRAS